MSRSWEIEDTQKVMPLDLVREQDFILRVRRMHRAGTPHLVVNLVLCAIPALVKSTRLLEEVQAGFKEFAKVTNGEYSEMSNGDVFIVWEETGDAALLVARLLKVLPAEAQDPKSVETFMLTYHMPQNYTVLRERTNHYVEVVRTAASMAPETAADALKSSSTQGPLTAERVGQIGKLVDDIDIRTYARKQPIYQYLEGGFWQQISEEYFISFDDLRRERFPKLDLITPEHLFFALCEKMDQRLLTILADKYATIADKPLYFNLSVATVIGDVFARFTHSVPAAKRELLTFELHRGDLFQDFARTLSAIEILHHAKFQVAVDSITPDMLPYINLSAFSFDKIKINVSGERAAMLGDAVTRRALAQLPVDRVIFFRCDSERALQAGLDLGVRIFQGWHIDDVASQKLKK